MTRADLIEAGRLLYGPDWQSPLARELGVALRSVQRWAAGHNPVPDLASEIAPKLLARVSLLESQAIQCRELARKLQRR